MRLIGLPDEKEIRSESRSKSTKRGLQEIKDRKQAQTARYERERQAWLLLHPNAAPSDFFPKSRYGSPYRRYCFLKGQKKREYRRRLYAYAYVRWGVLRPVGSGVTRWGDDEHQMLMNLISFGYNPETFMFENDDYVLEIPTPHKRGRNAVMSPRKGRWDLEYEDWLSIGGETVSKSNKLQFVRVDPMGPWCITNLAIRLKKA